MDIQDLGAIGELIGGVAVIASVIYLAIQIRHGISGYQSHAVIEITQHFSRLQLEIAGNDILLDVWTRAEARQPLSRIDQRRVISMISSYFIGFENLFTQCQSKVMPMEAFEARRPIIANMLTYTGIFEWWETTGRQQFPPAFLNEVDHIAAEFKVTPTPASLDDAGC